MILATDGACGCDDSELVTEAQANTAAGILGFAIGIDGADTTELVRIADCRPYSSPSTCSRMFFTTGFAALGNILPSLMGQTCSIFRQSKVVGAQDSADVEEVANAPLLAMMALPVPLKAALHLLPLVLALLVPLHVTIIIRVLSMLAITLVVVPILPLLATIIQLAQQTLAILLLDVSIPPLLATTTICALVILVTPKLVVSTLLLPAMIIILAPLILALLLPDVLTDLLSATTKMLALMMLVLMASANTLLHSLDALLAPSTRAPMEPIVIRSFVSLLVLRLLNAKPDLLIVMMEILVPRTHVQTPLPI